MFDMNEVNMKDIREDQLDSELPSFAMRNEVQEFAPSMEVQAAEIRDAFLEMPELSFDNWQELDLNERVDALNALEEKIAVIEMRDPVKVRMEELEPGTMGNFNGKYITMSGEMMRNDSYEGYREIMDTLFHEGRHAYQFYNLDVRQTEMSNTMVDSWRTNLERLGYESGQSKWFEPAHIGFWRYQSQPIEVDARLFAETACRAIGL